jgi:capsule polysaccharide export protein KpsE/RkpR
MANRHDNRSFLDMWSKVNAPDEGFTDDGAADYWTSALVGPDILDRVIREQARKDHRQVRSFSLEENRLKNTATLDVDHAGLLKITVANTDPRKALDIARDIIFAIHQSMEEMRQLDATGRIAVYQKLLDRQRELVRESEEAVLQTQLRTGVLKIDPQAAESIIQVALLRAAVTTEGIELQWRKTQATELDPDMQRLEAKIHADQAALDAAVNASGYRGLGVTNVSDVPQATRDSMEANRTLIENQALYEALGKQLSNAQTDATRDAPMIQIVEQPELADHPTNWPAAVVLLLYLIFGFMVGCALAGLKQVYQDYKSTPTGGQRLSTLRLHWHSRTPARAAS